MGVARQALNFKNMSLTEFVIQVAPSARTGPLTKVCIVPALIKFVKLQVRVLLWVYFFSSSAAPIRLLFHIYQPLLIGPVFIQAIEKSGVLAKWADTAWAKKVASRARRATLNDFERFQVKVNKQKRNRIIRAELRKQKK